MQISEILGWLGSVLATVAFLNNILPSQYRDYVGERLLNIFSPYAYFVIPEIDGGQNNDMYVRVQYYLGSLAPKRARVCHLMMPKNASTMTFSLADNQSIRDSFQGARVEWKQQYAERKNPIWSSSDSAETDEKRSFRLKVPRSHVDFVLEAYLPRVVEESRRLQRASRDLRLYSNNKMSRHRTRAGWGFTSFRHPTTFDTIAMDPELKRSIVSDLEDFSTSEEFYRRVGKAWKRGYLLFGPPGTGKTSIVAAIANRLRYDVYDLELTEVQSNADLRALLLSTSSKSIVLIEDIDCSLDLSGDRKKKKKKKKKNKKENVGDEPGQGGPRNGDNDEVSRVTTSGLLNFTDGLWSTSESERIFIFTTNHVKKLDPALLRPGRMDLHINLGYCSFTAFESLAQTYLRTTAHRLFPDVEMLMAGGTFLTPADVAEILTKHKHDVDTALERVVDALRDRQSKPPPAESEESASDSDDTDQVAEGSENGPKGAKGSEQTESASKENGN